MSESISLNQIQKRIYQMTTFEDGLWDLLLGLTFLLLSIYPLTWELLRPEWNVVLFLVVLGVLAAGQLALRRFLSLPRIGYARARRSPAMRAMLAFTILMVLLTLGLLLVTLLSPGSEAAPTAAASSSQRSYTVEILVVLVTGGIFSAMGYFFGVPRLYVYGWLIGLADLASVYMTHTSGWTFNLPLAVVAGLILLIGVALLSRFLRKYPVKSRES